jgi:hypothetical protein
MALALLVAISEPKKVSISRATPSLAPHLNGSCPPQNNYVPRHINNRYINSYFLTVLLLVLEKGDPDVLWLGGSGQHHTSLHHQVHALTGVSQHLRSTEVT